MLTASRRIDPHPERSMKTMYTILAVLVLTLATLPARAVQVFAQAPNPGGGQYKSAWYAPDGLDGDEYAFDNFTIDAGAAITEVRWRGAYTNYLQGAGRAPVYDFTVSIYRSIAGGSQPDLGTGGRLARFFVGGNAGETQAGTFGGVIMYDYAFTLPTPFQAAPGVRYWIQIEAWQGLTPLYNWPPDWSIAAGTGGNNSHFRRITGGPMQTIAGDCAFSLHATGGPTVAIAAAASPADAGTVAGAGDYPINTTATLDAASNAGWGFVNWTENGAQVSTNAHYTFTATVDRSLVANFAHSVNITGSVWPVYAGSISGTGVYIQGASVTLGAVPAPGFVFQRWSNGDTSPTVTFTAATDMQWTAFFRTAPGAVMFDFDNARQFSPLPIDLRVDGLGVHASATAGNYSVQAVGAVGLAPAGFSGLMLFPNTVFAADLVFDFSEQLRAFSILYSPQELGCDDSATMRVTAYRHGVMVGTDTATVPFPGTWPTGTLSIGVPGGFDRAVVHYDAAPRRCNDWGPIFLADNMLVTRLCRADYNHDGVLTSQDFFDFLTAFFSGSADFNGDGRTDSQDFFDFLGVFFAGC
jgi:hypothetical protein